MGRLLGDIVGSRLSQQGFTVVDIRTRQDSIFIQEQVGSSYSAEM
ncbi:MAG: FlgO family outer membrane protein [Bilophila wadsworthia]